VKKESALLRMNLLIKNMFYSIKNQPSDKRGDEYLEEIADQISLEYNENLFSIKNLQLQVN
jgi:hypothetical protein